MLGTEPIRAEALDDTEHQSADHRARHAAEATQNADHEGLAEKQRAIQRRNGKDDAKQRAGRARHERADGEGDRIDVLDVDAHQRRRLAVHADRDNGAPGAAVAQEPVEQHSQQQRQHHRGDAVARQVHRADL